MAYFKGTKRADQIIGTSGRDTIRGRQGDDIILGGDGDDKIFGNRGNDVLDGGNGNDIIRGGLGQDRILLSAGQDTIIGGLGADTVVFTTQHATSTWKDFKTGQDKIEISLPAELFEYMVTVTGSVENPGSAIVSYGNSSLELPGVDPQAVSIDDFSFVDPGYNYIHGTEAGESIVQSHTTENFNIDGKGGDDRITTGSGNDLVKGGDGNDRITSGAGDDVLMGGSGDDFLWGYVGNDLLIGGDGNDILKPGFGHDTVFGGTGVDVLDVERFAPEPDAGSVDIVWMDFEDSVDIIDVTAFKSLTSAAFENRVTITDDGQGNAHIAIQNNPFGPEYGFANITLIGVPAFSITIDDFLLA